MNVETTLTIPEGLGLKLVGDLVVVSISSNVKEGYSLEVPVLKEGEGYTFSVRIYLVINEEVDILTTWEVICEEPGEYNITVFSQSNDPFMILRYSRSMGSCRTEIVSGSPVVGDVQISPISTSPGLDPEELYVSPDSDIDVRCSVSCELGLNYVQLYYSNDSEVWVVLDMEDNGDDQWTAKIPSHPENKKVLFYIEAESTFMGVSRTSEYECTFLDIDDLKRNTNTLIFVSATVMVTGSVGIFSLYRRRKKEND